MRVGDTAPPFSLGGVDGPTGRSLTWSLADHAGHPVVLAFYPADDSPVCTRQLVDYTARIEEIRQLGASLVAISPQDEAAHRRFAKRHGGFSFPLLCDEDKSVGRAYGIVGMLGLYRRSLVVIGADGRVRYVHRALGAGLAYRSVEQIVHAVGGDAAARDGGAADA